MKKLVVFYSLGGNTRAVAYKFARALKADILEIRTEKAYPDDYDVLVGLGKQEITTGYMPKLRPYRIDLEKYDAVLVGTPVWWYTFAPAVKTFLKSHDWKGKRVFPFATNGGWLGHTPSDFKKALRGAELGPVLNVKFEEHVMVTPESELKEWLKLIQQ